MQVAGGFGPLTVVCRSELFAFMMAKVGNNSFH